MTPNSGDTDGGPGAAIPASLGSHANELSFGQISATRCQLFLFPSEAGAVIKSWLIFTSLPVSAVY